MRVYFSHKIRGEKGMKASKAEMKENCDEAIKVANEIRKALPQIDLYVPGEHEDFVQGAYELGLLNEEEILKVDCLLIERRAAVIIYAPDGEKIQGGREVERYHANTQFIPVCIFEKADEAIQWLADLQMRG